VSAVNSALVLLADHEMAASTLAARVAASVRADAHAVVSAGMGPMAGALHGQASRAVRALFDEAARTSPAAAVRRAAARPGPFPGVGHGLYPHGDPRAVALLAAVQAAGGATRRRRLVDEVVAEVAAQDLGRPNVDMALGALGHVWSMPPDAGEAVFAVARSAGWLAHGAEEWARRPLRFRARARYVGPRS
jgi:citrate synthase